MSAADSRLVAIFLNFSREEGRGLIFSRFPKLFRIRRFTRCERATGLKKTIVTLLYTSRRPHAHLYLWLGRCTNSIYMQRKSRPVYRSKAGANPATQTSSNRAEHIGSSAGPASQRHDPLSMKQNSCVGRSHVPPPIK